MNQSHENQSAPLKAGRILSGYAIVLFVLAVCSCTSRVTSTHEVQRAIPKQMSAQEYLELGKKYKASGWTEEARGALNQAIKMDKGDTGKQAQIFLNAYIPRHPVTKAAERKNIMGYNRMAHGDMAGAIKLFKECIRDYPNFEWPYGNLGSLYTEQGNLAEAKDVLSKALELNPNYVNGWLHLAEARLKDKDIAGARNALDRAAAIDPESTVVKAKISEFAEQEPSQTAD